MSLHLNKTTGKCQYIIWLILVLVIMTPLSPWAAEKDNMKGQKEYEAKAYTHSEVHSSGVSSALNRFLLVRKGNDGCAVRFTKFWRDYDEKNSTVFSSGQENVYAEYEWFYQGDGSFDFTKANVKHGYGKLHDGPSIGIGRAAFKFHLSLQANCGAFFMYWKYPTRLLFLDEDGLWDKEVEIAPTKWQTIGDVNFRYPNLLWTRYLDDRRKRYIPLDELP